MRKHAIYLIAIIIAIISFDTASFAKNAIFFNNQGMVWYKLGKYDQAIRHFNIALQIDPSNANIYYNLGMAWEKKEFYEQAMVNYSQAIKLNPNYVLAYTQRANLWVQKGRIDKAVADYKKTLAIKPNKAILHYNLACLYAKQDNSKAAFDQLEIAFKKGYKNFEWAIKDPDWSKLKNTKKFKLLIQIYSTDANKKQKI